jgi:hypothetical protein
MERKINLFDKIGSLIPGYKGYVIRDEKRNTDKKFRNDLASLLSNTEEYLIRYQKELIDSKEINAATNWEKARKSLNTIIPKIKYSTYGESSFFSEKQLKEEELDVIYNFDLELTERVSLIVKTIQEEITEPMSAGFVLKQMLEIEQIMSKRTNFINEYK